MALVTAHRVLDHNKANFEHDDLQWLVPGRHRKPSHALDRAIFGHLKSNVTSIWEERSEIYRPGIFPASGGLKIRSLA